MRRSDTRFEVALIARHTKTAGPWFSGLFAEAVIIDVLDGHPDLKEELGRRLAAVEDRLARPMRPVRSLPPPRVINADGLVDDLDDLG